MIDFFIFLIVETRLDIAFTTSITGHFAKNPRYLHTKVVKTIPQYLKIFKECGITYDSKNELLVERYLDSD